MPFVYSLLALLGMVEFVLRFVLVILLVLSIVGLFVIDVMSNDDLLTPYAWQMIERLHSVDKRR